MVRRFSIGLGAFCLALLALAAPAQAQSASISGTVTNVSGSAPIANVFVQACNGDNCTNGATTSSGGAFTISGLTNNVLYRLYTNASSAGFVDQFFTGSTNPSAAPTIECGGCQPTQSGGTAINVGTGANPNKNFVLRAGTSLIKAHITDLSTGLPISGINVNIFRTAGSFFGASGGATDSNGDFTSGALPAGIPFTAITSNNQGYIDRIYNNVPCIGGACGTGSGSSITFATVTDGTSSPLAFTLEKGGVISGTVTNNVPTPIQGANVSIFNSLGVQLTQVSTNASGVFTTGGLPSGTYYARAQTFGSPSLIPQLYNAIPCTSCSATSGTPVTVTAPSTTGSINFLLPPAGSISGMLTSATSGTGMVPSGPNFPSVQVYTTGGTFVASVGVTATDGSYTVGGLATGNYVVRGFGPQGSSFISKLYVSSPGPIDCPNCDVTAGSPISVTAGSPTTGINMALTTGATITGMVTNGSGATTSGFAPGAGLPGLSVTVLNSSGGFVASGFTNGSGVYSIGGLLAGTYYVKTNSSSTLNFVPEIFGGPGNHVVCVSCAVTIGTGLSVTLPAGAPTPADFSLQAGASITGAVTSAVSPFPGIQGFGVVSVTNSLGVFITSVSTNSSGAYTIAGLPAGTYFVKTNAGGGFIDQLYQSTTCLNCNATSGAPIVLATGGLLANVNFQLAVGGRISGRITDLNGAPLASTNSGFVGVNVNSASGSFVASATTDSGGNFITSTGLPTGTYFVVSVNSLGFINTLWDNIGCLGCFATSGTPIPVTAGNTTSGINLVLRDGGRITGNLRTPRVGSSPPTFDPIANAGVTVYTTAGLQLSTTFTNTLGNYTLTGLPTGAYFVKTTNGVGFIDQLFAGAPCLGCDVTTGTPVSATVGSTTTGINFTLDAGGTISGTVKDASSSAPLPNVGLQVYNSFGQFVASINTQSNGTYALKGLASGSYFVRTFNSIGYINLLHGTPDIICGNCAITSGAPVPVVSPATVSGVDFALNIGGTIKGKVTASDGTTPIAGVSINALTSTGSSVSGTSTDVAGNYVLSGIVPGTYFLKTFNSAGFVDQVYNGLECVNCTVTAGTTIAIAQGQTVLNVNFALLSGGRIRGTITDTAGTPIQGVNVQISRSNGSFVASATTGADGRYVSGTGLPPGDYVVRTTNTLGYVDKLYDNITCLGCTVSAGKLVTLTGAPSLVIAGADPGSVVTTATGIDFVLAAGGAFAGLITASDGVTPLQGVSVQAYTDSGLFVTSTTTNGAGRYVLRGLPTGSYVAKTFNSLGYIDQLYNGSSCTSCSVTAGTRIAVAVGNTTAGINYSLTAGGRIGGTITAATGGAPVPSVSVQIYTTTGVFVGSGFSSPAGTYVSGALPAGNYLVRTSFNSSNLINMVHASPADLMCQSCGSTTGAPVAVALGATTTVDFSLPGGGSISGTVTVDAGSAANVTVLVFSASAGSNNFPVNSAQTNATGAYSVGGLPTGSYVARTTNSSGFIDQLYNGQDCLSCNTNAGQPIAVTVGSNTPGVTFSLRSGGLVSGMVTDAATGAPIGGISIAIYNSSNFFVASAFTDNLGNYTTRSGIPTGTYYARTNNSIGYINVTYPTKTCQNCPVTVGTAFTVTAPQTKTGINFSLARGGRITGTIRDAGTGLGLGGVGVSVFLADGTSVGGTGTNFDGGYSTQGLPTGTYYIRTSNGLGYINRLFDAIDCVRCSVATGTPISVTAGSTTGNINIALSPGGRISGNITDAVTGAPLPGASVTIVDAGGFSITGAVSNANGDFISSGGLTSGTYYARTFNSLGYVNKLYDTFLCLSCNPTTGKPIVVTAGATATGINFALAPGGRIAGTISAAGSGVSNAFVNVFSSGGTFLTGAQTGSAGQYITPDGLPPGPYYLVTANQSGLVDQLYNGNTCGFACAVTTGTAVPVTGAATTAGINFNLQPGGRVSGKVTDKATGDPLPNIEVDIANSTGAFVAYGYTDGLGNYTTFGGVPTGTYFAQTFTGSRTNQHVNKLYNDITCASCNPLAGTGISVTVGATTAGINFALDVGSVISGTIKDAATGNPISGARVSLFDNQGNFVARGTSDDSGLYVMTTGVPAGTYFARTSNGLGFVDRLYDTSVCLACDVTRGTPIVVDGVAATSGINFTLNAGGRLTGTVTASAGGAPVAGSKIRIYNSAGSFLGQTFTNGVGMYITFGLPPGNYYVRTANTAGLIDKLFDNVPCAPCDVSAGRLVTVVTAGLKPGINFALDGGGLISGTVKDQATGSPIKGVTLSVYRSSDGVKVATTDPTDNNGYYQISLPIGTYQVEPNPVSGFRPPLGALRGPFARSTVVVDTGTETTGVGFSLVSCAPLTVGPATLPLGAKGQLYSTTLTATGGTAPFTFSISDGSPNTGLALAASGLLAGTPVSAGSGSFTVAAMDANQCGGSRTFALTACSFFLSTPSLSTTASPGNGTVDLTASSPDCPWTASAIAPWITITSGASGAGNTTATFSFSYNTTGAVRSGTIRLGGQIFTVTQAATSAVPPFGQIDTPAPGVTGVVGSLAVTGWALDAVEVKRVKISRDPVAGEGLSGDVYLGDATFVEGARPDVAAVNPGVPFNTRAGWGYLLLSNMLPGQGNGTYTLHVDAVDAVGSVTRLGNRTFTGDNANSVRPFGAIDTPAQGATVSGSSFVNFGWALTPNPKRVPIDGSTITVFIDSVPAGSPTYNQFRGDVAGLFPGLANTGGAIGFRYFDTTTWTNGVHTISWVVFDDAGQGEGIGSRYFSVNNALASQRLAPPSMSALRAGASGESGAGPVASARVGFDRTQPALELTPDPLGGRFVAVGQLNRLELRFGQACGAVNGVQIANGERVPLPVGATLDPSGAFFWMPGPAFLGTYNFEFSAPSCGGGVTKIPVAIAVGPGR